jgi:ATP-dependent Lon protease
MGRSASWPSLEEVAEACPNFAGVVEDLANYVALAAVREGGFYLSPILLAGDPGVGKTHFAKCLAKALGLNFEFISMGTLSANWVLSGSAPTWQGARYGKIAGTLIESQFANPLFLLDELDKTGGDSRFDPYGALLQLMEQDTASHFRDEYLDVPLDMSKVIYIGTANAVDRIPDFILSRMTVYEVPAPTPEEARVIATNIYRKLRDQHRYPFPPELEDDTLDVLQKVPPREIGKRILDGMAATVRAKGDRLTPERVRSSHDRVHRLMRGRAIGTVPPRCRFGVRRPPCPPRAP